MGLDGLSHNNLGLRQSKASNTLSFEAKEIITQNQENIVKSVDGLSKKQKTKARRKEDEDLNGEKLILQYDYIEEEEESLENSKNLNKDTKIRNLKKSDYKVKLNNKNNNAEIYDNNGKLIESIDLEDLSRIIKKLKVSKSIFYNETI